MYTGITIIEDGSVVTPRGFLAGATYAGLKTYGEDKLDLGILYSETAAAAAGTFSTNRFRSGSVVVSEQHIASGWARAVVVNSGVANAGVGAPGVKDAQEMTNLAAAQVDVNPDDVLVCSTGMIGVELPMALVRNGLTKISPSLQGGHLFARSILTTDSVSKEIAVSFSLGDQVIHLAGCTKGAAMIHPNMATMLCFLTTDASMDPAFLHSILKGAVDDSFNMISIDGDNSTNDTVIILANGAAGAAPICPGTLEAELFNEALEQVTTHLAKAIVRDGEGATKLFQVIVEGACTEAEARLAARSVSSSNLVKAAVHGNDPNWGRIIMAVGKSGAEVDPSKVDLYINEIFIMERGLPIPFSKEAVIATMQAPEIGFRIHLNLGDGTAMAWGCNLSEEYVTFNSAYTT
jgi:glutamate N-acetyltransferase/amino-acid N-acetyltransferase